jgi:hypothetical protein
VVDYSTIESGKKTSLVLVLLVGLHFWFNHS